MLRNMPMKGRRRVAAVGLVLTAALTAGACSGESGAAGDGSPLWVEPAWMAQFRQDMEAWQLEEIACYVEHGVAATPAPSGGVQLPIITLGESPAGMSDLIHYAMYACYARVEQLSWWRLPLDEAAHQRMLDSRECVIAHGYFVPEPPTYEVWREGGGGWLPHEFAFDAGRAAGMEWTASAWSDLNRACPQPGPKTFGVSDLPEATAGDSVRQPPASRVPEPRDRAPGMYRPPSPWDFTWRNGHGWIEDPCDEDQLIYTGSTFIRDYRVRGDHDGIRFDGWDLDWWLDGMWSPDAPPATDLIRVGHYFVGSRPRSTHTFEVEVLAVDSCDVVMTIDGQLRWTDGVPAPRGGPIGMDPPEFEFADTELGRLIRGLILTD